MTASAQIQYKTILDDILRALEFYCSPLSYPEKEVSQFFDVIDELQLAIKLEPPKNKLPIKNPENNEVKKKLERIAKRKAWRDNLRVLVQVPAAGFATLLSFCSRAPIPSSSRLVPALSFYSLFVALLSHPRSITSLLSRLVLTLSSRSISALSSSRHTPAAKLSLSTHVSHSETLIASLSCSVLGSALTHFTLAALRTSKRVLSDES